MLSALSISNIILIDHLDLDLRHGLCALTGETGAGKSILLDALGLALGSRGGADLVRKGAERGTVAATFDLPAGHPAWDILRQQDMAVDDGLILRRQIGADGRGRAFVNDQAISTSLLRQLGETLIEVHGQHDERGLLNPAGHRALLDIYGGLGGQVKNCVEAHVVMRRTAQAFADAQEALSAARTEEDYLRHVCAELQALDPKPGDEETLDRTRTQLRQGEKIAEALKDAQAALDGGDGGNGVEQRLRIAQRALQRVAESAGGALDAAIEGLERAAVEAMEGIETVAEGARSLDLDPSRLEAVEERLFALREAARKHRVSVDGLPALHDDFARRLDNIDNSDQRLAALETAADAARKTYLDAAEHLSEARVKAGAKLDRAMAVELPPLALDKATFQTVFSRRDEDNWSGEGWDRVAFHIATNPGSAPGPLQKVASGGELSRVMLALKVALSQNREPASLIFDEVDSGVGGAVADKVGERLARLAQGTQVIVVTHSPQVAARAGHHWLIVKRTNGGMNHTTVEALDAENRREEIARMLAGAKITDEARAAADSLLQAAGT
ncbi:MAG: DNA repair protein RecN [Alphaproteobacteria bacterium]|nr:DNA repair protein RecN [Alphaproteobacteria bacterium]